MLTVFLASGSNEQNKSTIPTGTDYGEKKGIPAGRPGKEEDMAQAALMLATNQYAYGQVSFMAFPTTSLKQPPRLSRLSPSMEAIYSFMDKVCAPQIFRPS